VCALVIPCGTRCRSARSRQSSRGAATVPLAGRAGSRHARVPGARVVSLATTPSVPFLNHREEKCVNISDQAPVAEPEPLEGAAGATVLIGATQLVNSPTPTPRPPSPVRFMAELTCLLCGRGQGCLEAGMWPPRGTALLRRPGAEQPIPVTERQRLCCGSCGGAVIVAEVAALAVRPEAPPEWEAEPPRRGRPPKWLVARRDAGLAASEAA